MWNGETRLPHKNNKYTPIKPKSYLRKFNISITVIILSPSCITNVKGSTMQRYFWRIKYYKLSIQINSYRRMDKMALKILLNVEKICHRNKTKKQREWKVNWSISMEMPELKCFSITCHIPGLGLRKGSAAWLEDSPNPQAIKTCTKIITIQLAYFTGYFSHQCELLFHWINLIGQVIQ